MPDSTPTPEIAEDLAACPECDGNGWSGGKVREVAEMDSACTACFGTGQVVTPPKAAGDAEEVAGRLEALTCDASSVRVVEQAIALIRTQAAELAKVGEEHHESIVAWRTAFDSMHRRAMQAEAARLTAERNLAAAVLCLTEIAEWNHDDTPPEWAARFLATQNKDASHAG